MYAKITAKADTWFDEGTEVWDYDGDGDERIKACDVKKALETGLFRGFRNGKVDGEWCSSDEFDVEIVHESSIGAHQV